MERKWHLTVTRSEPRMPRSVSKIGNQPLSGERDKRSAAKSSCHRERALGKDG